MGDGQAWEGVCTVQCWAQVSLACFGLLSISEFLWLMMLDRLCVGMQFATTSAAYTIVRIMQDYDRVEDCNEPGESKIATGLAGLRVGGMHLKLYPAKK